MGLSTALIFIRSPHSIWLSVLPFGRCRGRREIPQWVLKHDKILFEYQRLRLIMAIPFLALWGTYVLEPLSHRPERIRLLLMGFCILVVGLSFVRNIR